MCRVHLWPSNVKFQAYLCLKFDVDVFENAFFPWIVTFSLSKRRLPSGFVTFCRNWSTLYLIFDVNVFQSTSSPRKRHMLGTGVTNPDRDSKASQKDYKTFFLDLLWLDETYYTILYAYAICMCELEKAIVILRLIYYYLYTICMCELEKIIVILTRWLQWSQKCDDPGEKGIFKDVDVKFQAHLCLKFDVGVFEKRLFPMDDHKYSSFFLLCYL